MSRICGLWFNLQVRRGHKAEPSEQLRPGDSHSICCCCLHPSTTLFRLHRTYGQGCHKTLARGGQGLPSPSPLPTCLLHSLTLFLAPLLWRPVFFFSLAEVSRCCQQTKVQVLGGLSFVKDSTRNLLPWSHGRWERRKRTPAGRRRPARGDWPAGAPSCCEDPAFVGVATLMSCMDEKQQLSGSEELRCRTAAIAGSCNTRWNCFLKCDRSILHG